MSGFPTQLPWRRFAWLLRDLGYCPLKSYRGSVRQFFNPTRKPKPGLVPRASPGRHVEGYVSVDSHRDVHHNVVGSDYFAVMGIPLLAGRAASGRRILWLRRKLA